MARVDPEHSAADGNPIDWQAELAKNDRWLRTVVLARLGSREGLDEVMQEVALAAVRGTSPVRDPAKAAPWLYQVCVRQALLYRRRMGRHRKLVDRYTDRFQPTDEDRRTPDPLDWLLADERRKRVRQALASMPPKEAEILLLKYTEDYSYKLLAEHLGTSESAIESRLHRARKRMRERLTRLEVIETR